ncbi:hypothetical protein L7F22_008550 [Adiantum nelumboides]|nr:hypothetical protein [Adiantum nelumboides]
MDIEPMRDAYDRVYKKQKLWESQSEELINRLTREINVATRKVHSSEEVEGSEVRQVYSELQTILNGIGPLNQVGSAQKEVNLALLKYGKVLDKIFRADLANAHMGVDFNIQIINRVIAMHFLRLGEFDLGDCFLQESQVTDVAFKSTFHNMHHILEELKVRNLKPALVWAETHYEELLKVGSSLEFNLHELQYLQLLQEGSHLHALQYAKANFNRFAASHMGKIQRLMGSLVYVGRLDRSPYQDLVQSSNWDLISLQFTKDCCNLIGYSYQSALQVILSAGTQALPTFLKMVSLFGNRKQEWLTSKQLPIEIELDKDYQFHSIFACPVSKEQSTAENPPMLMPCGHVLCKQSLQKLSKSRNFKCPYCPHEVNMVSCKPIYF